MLPFLNRELKTILKDTEFLYWWNPGNKFRVIQRAFNVGDILSAYIVWNVMREKNETIKIDKKLLAIGSIMDHASDGDVIWGSGYNSNRQDMHYNFTQLDVRAVRGPLTKTFLENRGIYVPEVFGDPGLLSSKYFASSEIKDIEYLMIPHYNEDKHKFKAEFILETKGSVPKFMSQIVRAKKVISSSLHGIIIAESFGIPAVLLKDNNGEGIEKYDDYYQGSGRSNFPVCTSLNEALSVTPNALPDVHKIQQRLLNSFPTS
ncbi:polysaccharide pyruvyl transferase family protein [Moritella sp. F3]|uniref:polysaccharide pyruvyl transferase family protein n=1 Tax=Moritella sp. F3 TaxID=2718882 RepID=UPI0018E18AB2|nr:polysaccharide pyruvyl transferase family protein [Moritella sp. F3]GIC75723.1 GumL protein [Moritella sp. F1]GIC81829.1 GumL protein [Moritella sp. F3]